MIRGLRVPAPAADEGASFSLLRRVLAPAPGHVGAPRRPQLSAVTLSAANATASVTLWRHRLRSATRIALLASRPATKGGGILDLELDEFQLLGTIPVAVVDALWPGFVPQHHDVYVNPVYLRRHLQSRPDYVNRVAALNQYGHLLESCFAEAEMYARYDRVSSDEAGLDVFSRVELRREPAFVQIGVRLATASVVRHRRNYVATMMLVSTPRVHAILRRVPHCQP